MLFSSVDLEPYEVEVCILESRRIVIDVVFNKLMNVSDTGKICLCSPLHVEGQPDDAYALAEPAQSPPGKD